MSKFAYNKIGQYGHEVLAHIEKNKGVLKAIDGIDYTIDISRNSTYAKSGGFKEQVNNNQFAELESWLKKNQFEVVSPHTRDKKFEKLGWTEIEKSVFSSKTLKISTAQQENITLLIIKNVLGDDTQTWKSFDDMFHAKNSEIQKIFPELPKLTEWWANFELQFNEIAKIGKFPNSSYGVYLYDDPGNFMDYISNLVTKDLNLYTKKDSWNPADIWLIKSNVIKQQYIAKFDAIKEELDKGDKSKYVADRYQAIRDINFHLKEAYAKKDIVGISLKKSDGKRLHYTEFNLQTNAEKQKLPDVKFKSISLNCSYDKMNNQFTSKTSQVFVDDGPRGAYKLGFKSNTGMGIGNITYEFLPDAPASAFLGKVPKDQLKSWLVEQIKTLKKGVLQSENIQMPQGINLNTEWSKEYETEWDTKVAFIKKQFKIPSELTAISLDNFVENLKDSYLYGGLSEKNSSMMQMVEFVWILAKLRANKKHGSNNLILFLTLAYYYAQKKGQKYNFGPFAKVY